MRVCVIGAGPSGLTTIKQLLDERHEVTCFERADDIGGIWYRHPGDEGQMKVFDGVVLTVSMKMMSFSDFMVDSERVFTDWSGYWDYLDEYANEFGLRRHIRFETEVQDVRRQGNRWLVRVKRNGAEELHEFDAVAVCSGPFQKAFSGVEGIERFTGEVIHSSRYRNNLGLEGKRVLVVGLAESGADIVREVSDVASECTLAIRSRAFLLPRLFNGEFSTDMMTYRAHHYEMYVRATEVPYRANAIFGKSVAARSMFKAAASAYGWAAVAADHLRARFAPDNPSVPPQKNNLGEPFVPSKLDLATLNTPAHVEAINDWNIKSHRGEGNWSQRAIFCKNVSFIPNLVSGKIKVNDSGIKSMDGQRVEFHDGESREYDVIVLCTGFVKDFSVLGDTAVEDNNVRNLYKHFLHPEHDGSLALIGFVRPFSGGIPICSEMQARYFALLCSGKLKLPDDLHERIAQDKDWEEHWTSLSPRHTEAFPSQVLYLDSLAHEIGCLTPLPELLLNPRLLLKHWFYSFNQASYRLRGPHHLRDKAMRSLMREELPARSIKSISRHLKLLWKSPQEHPKDRFLPIPEVDSTDDSVSVEANVVASQL